MKLVNFSVTNFRSITTAHKVAVSDITVLVGRNNEGKSNLLKALDVAMTSLQFHSRIMSLYGGVDQSKDEKFYFWERDFPITLQNRKKGTHTIIRLEFDLNRTEVDEFKSAIKSSLNGNLPIVIKIGKDNRPSVEVSKRGKGSTQLNSKSHQIAEFIANKIVFNYIPAVRTDQEALQVVRRMLSVRLRVLESDQQYKAALDTIKELQKPILDSLSKRIKESLEEFLPGIKHVSITTPDNVRRSHLRQDFDIIIDDGTPTNLSFKGDGVKSLAALGLLKDRVKTDGASIVAIEEPESHLHPAAIHQLNDVIHTLSNENQVLITTHNPLFVDRHDIKSNIIVDKGKALPAKNINQVRDLLGIKASDNLTNAGYVLVVEGGSDVASLKALLSEYSEKLKKHIHNHMLIIEQIGGASNLPYKLSILKNSLCVYHCFLDNDDEGRRAYTSAEKEGLLSIKNNTFLTCHGFKNSEFEDCLELDLYYKEVKERFGIELDCSQFKGNEKWSDRVKAACIDQGKLWTDNTQSQIKFLVAECVANNPKSALNVHKRNSIDALIKSLEELIKN